MRRKVNNVTTKQRRYFVSVNFICDTNGSEPTQDQLHEALKERLEDKGTEEFEIYEDAWLDERGREK